MRVLQIGPYPPPHGGVQTNLAGIRERLRQLGDAGFVINVTRHRRENTDGVHYPRSVLEVLQLLASLPCEIVHLHLGGNLTPRLIALAFCCTLTGRKTVLTFHSGGYAGSPEGRTASHQTLRGFVFRRFDRIIVVNEEMARLFRRFGVREDRIRLILPYALPSQPPSAELPEPIARFFAKHEQVLLTVGLLEPEYDLKLQIDVLGEVRRSFPGIGLVIIGSGSLESDLRAYIRSKPYAEHVLLCGDVPHPATLAAISRCDALLRTTLYDGDAVSVREALHLGAPVIATDNGMRPPGPDLIPVSDAAALARAIERRLRAGRDPAAPPAAEDTTGRVIDVYRELLA